MERVWLGEVSYSDGLKNQDLYLQKVSQGTDPKTAFILGLEHKSVITLGKRSDRKVDLKWNEVEIKESSLEIFEVDRGGEATLHSPGQLVIYPVLSLAGYGLGVRDYVSALEGATVRFLKAFGIEVTRGCDEPGLYSDRGKIAFFGVRIRAGITQHGIAINVRNNMGLFQAIRSCGKADERFDQMANYGVKKDLSELFELWCQELERGLTEAHPSR